METIYKKLSLVLLLLTIISTQISFSQVLISNSTGTPDNSAMLEIRSNDKGMLIPRIATADREAMHTNGIAKAGLLVFDKGLGSFFIYGETAKGTDGWIDLSTDAGIWTRNDTCIYLSDPRYNVGIGTNTPNRKFVLKAENDNDTLFEIQDKNGKPLMLITPTLTKFYFHETKKKGIAGGFAVGRYATAKATDPDTALFIVTPDSTRVYTSGLASTVEAGGFAVGRYATAKGSPIKFFNTNIHNTRVYTDGDAKKGIAGGFAVGRYATAKGDNTNKYFYADIDSTRIYTNGGSSKGIAGGFAVGRYATAKVGGSSNYMYMLPDNYFIGDSSGLEIQKGNGTGKYNTFFGFKTGMNDTSGSRNVLLGYEAGLNNFVGNDNVSLGYQAGREASIATNNINIGTLAGFNNDSASNNIFIGNRAGFNHMESQDILNHADNNIYLGNQAGFGQFGADSSFNNIFIGNQAGFASEYSTANLFLGNQAGMSNRTGNQNVFLGNNAGISCISGLANVLIGDFAGEHITSGKFNVFVGRQAGDSLRTGQANVFIGDYAGHDIAYASYSNTFVGDGAGIYAVKGNNNIFMGAYSGKFHKIGNDNVYLGNLAGAGDENFVSTDVGNQRNVILGANSGTFMNDAIDNIFIGHKAGEGSLAGPVTGDFNVIIGEQSGSHLSSGHSNVFIGKQTGFNTTKGRNNIFIGKEAGYSNLGTASANWQYVPGDENVFIGNYSGRGNTDGYWNVFIGNNAGKILTSGYRNVFLGDDAGQKITSSQFNVIIGDGAAYDATGGNHNTMIGTDVGFAQETGGDYNVFVGEYAGYYSRTGKKNVYLGNDAGYYCVGGYNNVFLGYKAGYNERNSNKLYIENSDSSTPLIYGNFAEDSVIIYKYLNVNNKYTFPTLDGNANEVLVTDGSGNVSWTNASALDDGDWTVSGNNMYSSVSGFLGVGTNTPDNKLDINGKISVTQSTNDEMVIINDDVWTHNNGIQDFGSGGDYFIMASKEGSDESAGIYGDGNAVTIWSAGDANQGQPAAFLYILDEDFFDSSDTNPYNNAALKAYVATDGVWTVSDKNKKQKIKKIKSAGYKISKLNGYTYEFKLAPKEVAKGQKATAASGLLAQELELVIPEAVQTNDFGEKFVNYSAVIPLLIEGIKEQQKEIDKLKQKNTKIEMLEKQIKELKELIQRK